MTTQYKIVLVRHGESQWNLENRFCGMLLNDFVELILYVSKFYRLA